MIWVKQKHMIFIKKSIKYIMYCMVAVLGYFLFAVLVSYISVVKKETAKSEEKTVYLHSNGVHLSIIIPFKEISDSLKKGMQYTQSPKYVKFGWGDENFYLNVPTWNDFRLQYAVGALFCNNSTVIHITNEYMKKKNWIAVKLSVNSLNKMNIYIENSFKLNEKGNKILVAQDVYGKYNFFYKAHGSYSPIKTCNTWVNNCFKYSGLDASYWTIFDFGLLNNYK